MQSAQNHAACYIEIDGQTERNQQTEDERVGMQRIGSHTPGSQAQLSLRWPLAKFLTS